MPILNILPIVNSFNRWEWMMSYWRLYSVFFVGVLVLTIPTPSQSEVKILPLDNLDVEVGFDFENRTPFIKISFGEAGDFLDLVERIDSAYLIVELSINTRLPDNLELGCLKVAPILPGGLISPTSSFEEFNLANDQFQTVILNISDILHYWQKDPTLERALAISRCNNSHPGLVIRQVRLEGARIEVRHSPARK